MSTDRTETMTVLVLTRNEAGNLPVLFRGLERVLGPVNLVNLTAFENAL